MGKQNVVRLIALIVGMHYAVAKNILMNILLSWVLKQSIMCVVQHVLPQVKADGRLYGQTYNQNAVGVNLGHTNSFWQISLADKKMMNHENPKVFLTGS